MNPHDSFITSRLLWSRLVRTVIGVQPSLITTWLIQTSWLDSASSDIPSARPRFGVPRECQTSPMKNHQVLQPSEGSRRRPDKRLLDLVLLLIILPLAAPLFLLLALVVRCMLGSPILFRHQRPGLYGTPFTLL